MKKLELGIKGNYATLKNVALLRELVFVELEIQEPSELIINAIEPEKGMITGKAYIIKIGEGCSDRVKGLKFGTRVQLRTNGEDYLEPVIDISNTNVPKYIPNPRTKIFTFSVDPSKNESFKKYPTALIDEWDIIAVYD